MFGRTKRGSTLSTLVLALALVLTVFLPDLVAGKPDPTGPAHLPAASSAPRPDLTPATFVDTTVVDFSAGTLDAGTYVSETTDGEVILAPTFGAEFSGDALPAGMSAAQWFAPSGSASVTGGKLTLDGVRVGTDALYGPGRSLEFSGNFTGASLNSSGFGTNFTAAPWAVFNTGLFVFNLTDSTNNGTAQTGNVPGSLFNAFHRYRIDWNADSVLYFVDGTLVATHTNPPTDDMRPLFSDFFPGGRDQVVDWVRMSPYSLTGTFVSRVFDAGSGAHWIDLQATSEMPAGTNIMIETSSGDTVPPDATWSPWTGLSGNAITSPNARYLRYRATLSTTDPSLTPALQSATISYLAPCVPETCNGIDDDCDGTIDNGTGLCDDHNPCTADSCENGQCVFKPVAGVACDDGNACTTGDACNADGRCAGTPTVCNDDNPCTADACENGQCVFKPVAGVACDDGDACTTGDACNADGRCAGSPILCDDGNACTADACVNGACVSQPTPGAPCSDGNACTDHDICNADGQCAGTPILCDDGNACTADACENGVCVSKPTPGAPCSDGNACTDHDVCNADGRCVGTSIACDDQNPCTADTCENGQCVFTSTPGAACDDGNACTADDRCVESPLGGVTCQGTPTNCDDNNPCTVDRCEPQGCVVADNGEGTADLPPQGCGYVSQSPLMILDGLPAGSGIELAARHGGFSCPTASALCSFTPPIPGVDCDQPGGTLGGEQECASATLALNLTGTGSLAGFSRSISLAVDSETEDGPRTLGDPVQTFPTDVFRLSGQIAGDPDFDLLRITAGKDLGLPSPGQTTLTQVSGGQWAVDGFFDITYQIDFIGAAGGALEGMSGSTTGTVRFSTGGGQCVHTPVDCDDGNPCTTDRCNPDSGKCEHQPVVCDDGNQCTRDFCDPQSGTCRSEPTPGATCDDGNACTQGDACNADGQCAGTPISCDDQNPCTADSCDNGRCVFTPTPGAACDDGNACTTDDKCVQTPAGGAACEGTPRSCDDQNPCTKDSCDAATGQCVHAPAPGEPCDDGNACTHGDACNADGQCAGTPVACDDQNPCTTDSCENGQCVFTPTAGAACDDGNACTHGDVCNADGQCAGSPILCDDGNRCTTDFCRDGECFFVPTPGGECDDGNACTTGDTCTPDGRCAGTPVVCDDGNACTTDTCDPATGRCVSAPSTVFAEGFESELTQWASTDTLVRTSDQFFEGSFSATFTGQTSGSFAPRSMPFPVDPGRQYFLHVAYRTEGGGGYIGVDLFDATQTRLGEQWLIGDGGDASNLRTWDCNVSSCDASSLSTWKTYIQPYVIPAGVQFIDIKIEDFERGLPDGPPVFFDSISLSTSAPTEPACDDGNPCTTGDACTTDGTCAGNPIVCDDHNACTADSCVDGQCIFKPTPGAPCSDGSSCSTDDVCNADGRCVGTPVVCDDQNPCTRDSCDNGQCVFTPTPGASCDDSNACTTDDRCVETTAGGIACLGTPQSCDDQNPCTRDSCDPATGLCRHDPLTGATCDDGNACTTDDRCVQTTAGGIACVGTERNCDDQNQCTRDACNPTTGQCVHDLTPGATCDDGNTCTRGDVCNSDGRCAGTPITCNDDNSCTADACVNGQCVFTPTPNTACDDGNACTRGDTCNADGRCVGAAVSCDDGNGCTDDSCNPSSGCVHVNNSAACDDGNSCTTGDVCRNGQCAGGPPPSCDDGNACTADTCDPKTGCVHSPLGVLQSVCSINPATLNLNAQGSSFTINLSVVDACNPASPSPIPPGSLGIAHVSRAGNTNFPDPATLSCPDPDGGTRFETGLFEDLAARSISGNTASLKFDRPGDGVCSTLDGNRQDLIAAMTDVPDGSSADVCVSSTVGGQVLQCCTSARVLNHGNRR